MSTKKGYSEECPFFVLIFRRRKEKISVIRGPPCTLRSA